MSHTPGPYHYRPNPEPRGGEARWWIDAPKELNAEFHAEVGPPIANAYEERNAAFIVRACNAHDELLAALEELRHEITHDSEGDLTRADFALLLSRADDAIAKARA